MNINKRLSVAQSIRQRMESGDIIKAVFYARTSTLKDEQKDSCDNQIAMGNVFLKNHPNIKLVGVYVDKGISGKSNLKRDDFMEMLERVKQGDIDLIIVKTKARLCRSKAISALLEEMMRDYKFSILTLSDGQIYDSSDRSSRLINGIKDVIDEDYVWGQSEYGKMTHQLRCEKKILTQNNVTFGFSWNKEYKDMEINWKEANIKIQMFEWYVYNGFGVLEISRKLGEMGIHGKNSNKLITARTITQWLQDESSVGVFYINKKGSELDLGNDRTTKRFDNPKEEWVRIDRPDLAFMDRSLFDMAQKIREERRATYDKPSKQATQSRFKGFHLFASKVFCGSCGTQFIHGYSDRANTISIYKDYFSKKPKEANEKCDNKNYNKIHEVTLSNITKKAINMTLENKEVIFQNLFSIISESILETEDTTPNTENLQNRLSKLEDEKRSYFESWRTAPDEEMKQYFYDGITKIKEQIETIKSELSTVTTKRDDSHIKEQLLKVKARLNELQCIKNVDRNIVEHFVDRITIDSDGKLFITLSVGSKFKTDLPDYKEVATSLKNGEVVQYINNYKRLLDFWGNVGRLGITGMMVVFPLVMLIRHRIC